jgi:hypothetical protein
MKHAIAAIILIVSAGCGSQISTPVDNPAQDALDSVKESVTEALASVRTITSPPPKEEGGDLPDETAPLAAAVGAVVKAASDFANAAAGTPMKADADGLLSAARDLEAKSKNPSSASEIESGLLQLLAKIAELRQQR